MMEQRGLSLMRTPARPQDGDDEGEELLTEPRKNEKSTRCSLMTPFIPATTGNIRTSGPRTNLLSTDSHAAQALARHEKRQRLSPDGSTTPPSRAPARTPANRTEFGTNRTAVTGGQRSNKSTSQPSARYTIAPTPYDAPTPAPTNQNPVLLAVVEGRGLACETGMAVVDLTQPRVQLFQFTDNQTYVKAVTTIDVLRPVEIIFPSTACENGKTSHLYKILRDRFPDADLVTVARKYFNETKGLEYVKRLCHKDSLPAVEVEVASKYYCLATAAALLKYIEHIQNYVYAPGSLDVAFSNGLNVMMMDMNTVRNLELVCNRRDPKSTHTLFGALNKTLTAPVLIDPTHQCGDRDTIVLRHEAVEELLGNQDMFTSVRGTLQRFLDLDHLLALAGCIVNNKVDHGMWFSPSSQLIQMPKTENLRTAEANIVNIICLKQVIELVDPLRDALAGTNTPLLQAFHNSLCDTRFAQVLEIILTTINADTQYQPGTLNMRAQKCFAVKPSINGLLDVARRTYTETVEDIYQLVSTYGEKYGLNLNAVYTAGRGFHIAVSGSVETLPDLFIHVQKTRKGKMTCTTQDLIRYNDRVEESLQEVYLMTGITISETLSKIREHLGCLYKLTEVVAMLDMLASFAQSCTLSDCVRPIFTDTLAVKQGRHPIRELCFPELKFVPNDAYASDVSNFFVITGPNMSGKSMYLHQMALLQIMVWQRPTPWRMVIPAQIGSYVPAQFASFRLADHLFTRVGSDDDIESNFSSFMLEMKEAAYILQNATDKSLIIIDELGRGTTLLEGAGLCHAICEYLLSIKAFTFFVTHFLELTRLAEMYPNVENVCFAVEATQDEVELSHRHLRYTHTLSKGWRADVHYGIDLAAQAGFPPAVISYARELAAQIRDSQERRRASADRNAAAHKLRHQLATRLLQAARSSRLDATSLRAYLHALRDEYEQGTASLQT